MARCWPARCRASMCQRAITHRPPLARPRCWRRVRSRPRARRAGSAPAPTWCCSCRADAGQRAPVPRCDNVQSPPPAVGQASAPAARTAGSAPAPTWCNSCRGQLLASALQRAIATARRWKAATPAAPIWYASCRATAERGPGSRASKRTVAAISVIDSCADSLACSLRPPAPACASLALLACLQRSRPQGPLQPPCPRRLAAPAGRARASAAPTAPP